MASLTQKFFKALLPSSTFQNLEATSRQWYFQCACGNKINLWESGGIRHRAIGNPKRLVACPACKKIQMLAMKREAGN